MSLFKKATNEQGFLKAAIMGFPGAGKTHTASAVAIGLHKKIASKKPIFVIDTEKGFDYLIKDKFDPANIDVQILRTRAFVDLIEGLDEAEKSSEIIILDSITHFWTDLQDSFLKSSGRTSLRIQDWKPLKTKWGGFTTRFLNSNLHIIMCGRAGDDYDSFENEEGKLEHHKSGTKMQAEKNIGFEPGLVVEMERVVVGPQKRGVRNFANRAHILKDRFDVIDGQFFDNPTFDSFLPHIERLALGNHTPIATKDSAEIFKNDKEKNYFEHKKEVETLKEEIEGELTSAHPGRSTEEVKAKTDLLQASFGTRSWTAISDMKPEALRSGLRELKNKLAATGGK